MAVVSASRNARFALAAGNESDNHSPARADGATMYAASAVDSADRFASFSNHGNPPVDAAAPGVGVLSAWTRFTSGYVGECWPPVRTGLSDR